MISVRLSDTLVPVCATVLERVKRLFDLHADPAAIDAVLGPLAQAASRLRVPGSFDGFEMAVRAILGQQISVAAAGTLAGRLVARFGTPLSNSFCRVEFSFSDASQIACFNAEEIGRLGITGRAQNPHCPGPGRSSAATCIWSRATGSKELCGNFGKFPASGNGPRNTSPCARFPGRTLFRTRIWASERRWEEAAQKKFWKWPKNGGRGGLMPLCIFGQRWRKNDDRYFIKTKNDNELSLQNNGFGGRKTQSDRDGQRAGGNSLGK